MVQCADWRSINVRNFVVLNDEMTGTLEPRGLNPSNLYDYYNYISICKGAGKTIALINAYKYVNAQRDLDIFSRKFGLPDANLEIAYPQGNAIDATDLWLLEASLDLQWAHAMAPNAKLMLVSAKTSTIGNLFDAVSYAVNHGADIISMSWGINDSRLSVTLDKYFKNSNVTFIAAVGNNPGRPTFPSTSFNVIGVGGTELIRNVTGELANEIAWKCTGGGPSRFIPMPSWQKEFGICRISGRCRATPDVAFNASPASGVSVYSTSATENQGKWYVVGGTSLGAPSWAGILASMNLDKLNNSNRIARTLYEIAGRTSYTNPVDAFNDITEGSAGNYCAKEGYDLLTGLGSPNIEQLACAIETLY